MRRIYSKGPSWTLTAALVAATAAVTGVISAQGVMTESQTTFYACLQKGALTHVQEVSEACSSGKLVKWNQIGKQGLRGLSGLRGPAGPQGLVGPQGERGPQGANGSQGPAGARGLQGDTGATGPNPVGGYFLSYSSSYEGNDCQPITASSQQYNGTWSVDSSGGLLYLCPFDPTTTSPTTTTTTSPFVVSNQTLTFPGNGTSTASWNVLSGQTGTGLQLISVGAPYPLPSYDSTLSDYNISWDASGNYSIHLSVGTYTMSLPITIKNSAGQIASGTVTLVADVTQG